MFYAATFQVSHNSSVKYPVGAFVPFFFFPAQKAAAGKDFLYQHHHQIWYDLTQLMHNLPIFGLGYEQRIDHVLTLFIVLEGGTEYIVRNQTNNSLRMDTRQRFSIHVSKWNKLRRNYLFKADILYIQCLDL